MYLFCNPFGFKLKPKKSLCNQKRFIYFCSPNFERHYDEYFEDI